jgi:hypothetical protein
VDIAVRLGTGFDMLWVARVEGPLFLGASLLLLRLQRRSPSVARWRRVFETGVVIALALAGLRALLWASGLPVNRANIVVLAVAAVGAAARPA